MGKQGGGTALQFSCLRGSLKILCSEHFVSKENLNASEGLFNMILGVFFCTLLLFCMHLIFISQAFCQLTVCCAERGSEQ